MKKFFILFVGIILTVSVFAQQVTKKYVLVETCTEDGCPYCPYAQEGLEYLAHNGYNIVPLHYHYGNIGNSDGDHRISFYNLQGFPTSYFNGTLDEVGGYSGTTNDYINDYNSVKDDMTSFVCSIDSISSPNHVDYTVYVKVKKVADYSGTNIKLLTAVTENYIQYSWETDHLAYLERGMYPDYNGTSISLNTGDSVTVPISLSVDDTWNLDSLNFVAFVQDFSSKEVLNADMTPLFAPIGQNNAGISQIISPLDSEIVCIKKLSPVVRLKNYGIDTLKSCDIYAVVNGDTVSVTSWTGNLLSAQSEVVELDSFNYAQLPLNSLVVIAKNPNGAEDDDFADNVDSISFLKSVETSTRLFLSMNTGKWGFEISYQLLDSAGNVLAESGSLNSNQTVLDTFVVDYQKCAYFRLLDSYGNGFNSDDGYCRIIDKDSNELFYASGNFGSVKEFIFRPTTIASNNEISKSNFYVFPNPVNDVLNIRLSKVGNYDINIFTADGRLVKTDKIKNSAMKTMNIDGLNTGVYILKVSGNQVYTQKIIIR